MKENMKCNFLKNNSVNLMIILLKTYISKIMNHQNFQVINRVNQI